MSVHDIIVNFSKNTDNIVYISTCNSPLGKTVAAADDNYLYIISFEDAKNLRKSFETLSKKLSCKFVEGNNEILQKFQHELSEYFAGNLKTFTVPIKLYGTEFQNAVWSQLLKVSYGSIQSYGDIAHALGWTPSHSRAIGTACGANPIPIIVPCHRIIASSAKGGGYSGGMDRKNILLQLENKILC